MKFTPIWKLSTKLIVSHDRWVINGIFLSYLLPFFSYLLPLTGYSLIWLVFLQSFSTFKKLGMLIIHVSANEIILNHEIEWIWNALNFTTIIDQFESTAHTISVQKLEEKSSKVNLIAIIVIAILLVISFVFHVYFIFQNRRQKPPNKQENINHIYKNDTNNSKVFKDNRIKTDDGDCEQVEINDGFNVYSPQKTWR